MRMVYSVEVAYSPKRRRWYWSIFDSRGKIVDEGWNGGENAAFQTHQNLGAATLLLHQQDPPF